MREHFSVKIRTAIASISGRTLCGTDWDTTKKTAHLSCNESAKRVAIQPNRRTQPFARRVMRPAIKFRRLESGFCNRKALKYRYQVGGDKNVGVCALALQLEFVSSRPRSAEEGITLFAFHGKLNEEFDSRDSGSWSRDIIRARNGRFTFRDCDTKLKVRIRWYRKYAAIFGMFVHLRSAIPSISGRSLFGMGWATIRMMAYFRLQAPVWTRMRPFISHVSQVMRPAIKFRRQCSSHFNRKVSKFRYQVRIIK